MTKALKEEIGLYIKDKWLLASVSLIPLLLFIVIISIFTNNAIENMPIGVVDYDNSSFSRKLIRNLNSNKTIKVSRLYINEQRAFEDMKSAKIYAVLVIPEGMKTNFTKGIVTNIWVSYNTQFIAVGRSVKSGIELVLAYFNARLTAGKSLFKAHTTLVDAKAKALPFSHQITPVYNLGLDYSKFLLSLMLPCVWQIILVASMVLNLCSQGAKVPYGEWFRYDIGKKITAKIFVHLLLMMILYLSLMGYFYGYLRWDMRGSLFFLILAGFLTTIASQAYAFHFYFTSFDRARAISTAAAFSAPSLAFIGITFPFDEMSTFAQIWSSFLPITHYINIQLSQATYGSESFNLKDIYWLLGFNINFLIAYLGAKFLAGKKS